MKQMLLYQMTILMFCLSLVYGNPNEITLAVDRLGPSTTPSDLSTLRDDPALSISLLIQQLHPVEEEVVLSSEYKQHTSALRVVWLLRALRYLTHEEFSGKTTFEFEGDEKTMRRAFMLRKRNSQTNEVSFFAVWPSRDSIYFAPRDAQLRIISEWKSWWKKESNTFKLKPEKSSAEWYF